MTKTNDIVVADRSQPAELVPLEREIESGSLASVLQRRWRTMLLVTTIAGAVSCSAIWLHMRPKYAVGGTVHVAPIVRPILFKDVDTDISRQYREYMATEARVMVSPAVIRSTLNTPGVRSLSSIVRAVDPAADIQERLEVEQVRGTQLIQVTMTGEHAEDMAVILNSLLRTYLRLREDKKREWDEKILSSLRVEQAELEARLGAKSEELWLLAVDSGLGTAESSQASIETWAAELQQLMTQAYKNQAVAAAKLETLDASDGRDALTEADRSATGGPVGSPPGFEEYLRTDPEWQAYKEQVRSLRLAAFDDEGLGRGPAHPDVIGRPKRIAALREELSARETQLRELCKASLRRDLEAERLDAEITAKVLGEEMDRLTRERVNVAGQAFALEDVRHERERLEQALLQVRQKIWNVEVEQNRTARVTIDSPAQAPKVPNIDRRLKYTAAACLMSLFFGAAAALVRHRCDTSIRDPAEVTERLSMPLLGSVQYVPNRNGVGLGSDERVLEPMRGIATALLVSSGTGQRHSRLITSPTARGGKSSLAINLARSLASTGRQVLLVDADNKGQGVTRAFETTGRPGLKELLDGTCPPEQAVHPSEVGNLKILPAGHHDERFGEILTRRRAQEAVRRLFEAYDEVIVDSPPVLVSADAVVLATLVDEVVLVLRAGKNTREEAQAARRYLAAVGAKLVGVILNAVDPKISPYSYYGYAYADRHDKRDT